MVTIRRWGDSLAVTIPPMETKQKGLREGDDVEIRIYKKLDKNIFGIIPEKYMKKVSGQHAKVMLREEW
ncbi:MAG: hypothetical protein AABY14_01965 [Nanoarchaeota archaeon]